MLYNKNRTYKTTQAGNTENYKLNLKLNQTINTIKMRSKLTSLFVVKVKE